MARKKTWKKRAYRKKRAYKSKKKTTKKMINRALASRGLLHPEIKHQLNFVYSANVGNSLSTAPYMTYPTLSQGASGSQMVGTDITAKWLRIQGHINNTGSMDAIYRWVVVEDLQPVAGTLMMYSATATAAYNMLQSNFLDSPWLVETPRRFKVLWDHLRIIKPGTKDSTSVSRHLVRKWIRLGNAKVNNVSGVTSYYPVNRMYYVFLLSNESFLYTTHQIDFAYQDV